MFFNLGSAELPSFWKIYDKRIRRHPKQTNFIVGPWKKKNEFDVKASGQNMGRLVFISFFGRVPLWFWAHNPRLS